jgi:Tol biopolymer transport system component
MALEPESRTEPRVVFSMPGILGLTDVSPDNRVLSLTATDSTSGANQAYLVPVDGSGAPVVVDASAEQAMNGQFTPDGRWIAYALVDQGAFRIYLKTNPPTSRKWQLTDVEAFWYGWSPAGDRLYFQGGASELYVAEVDLSGNTPRSGQTSVLIEEFPNPVTNLHDFAVSSDGQTFFVSDAGSTDDTRPLRMIRSWTRLVDAGADSR